MWDKEYTLARHLTDEWDVAGQRAKTTPMATREIRMLTQGRLIVFHIGLLLAHS